MLSNYKHEGTYTESKGVIILYNNKKVKIEHVSIIEDGMIVSFRLKIPNETIRILGCYAPSSGDVINNWIKENEILDLYRFTNGNEQIWTYKVKENHAQTLKSRIDYVLGTLSLSNAISDVKHIFHEYELIDHATSFFSIDFVPANKGPGVF